MIHCFLGQFITNEVAKKECSKSKSSTNKNSSGKKNLKVNVDTKSTETGNNQDDDEIIGDPLFISYNVTFSEEATNDGLPFLSTNSQNLPIDNLNSQDHTVSPKNLQKSAKNVIKGKQQCI